VLLPSRFEGVPLIVLEAQRFGCAVVATDVGATDEAIDHAADGFLVPHDLPEAAMADAMAALLLRIDEEPELLAEVGCPRRAPRGAPGSADGLRDFLDHLDRVVRRRCDDPVRGPVGAARPRRRRRAGAAGAPGRGGRRLAGPAGLALWLATPASGGSGGVRLHRPGDDPARATQAMPAAPAGLLAVVAPDAAAAPPLLAAVGGPPLIEAKDAAAALPALARVVVATPRRRARRGGRTARGGGDPPPRGRGHARRHARRPARRRPPHPPPPPVLALEALPSPRGTPRHSKTGGRASAGSRREPGRHRVLGAARGGSGAGGARASASPVRRGKRARARLLGRAGRSVGAGLASLDLPTPIGPVRETACLDLRADVPAAEGSVALSLEDRLAPPDRAAVQGGAPGERALALRLWTAPFGRRFAVAPHWDWEEVELSLAGSPGAAPPDVPLGVKVQFPAQVWAAALLPQGRAERVALGAEAPRLVAEMGGGERCLLVLPSIPVAGLDLLQAEVSAAMGDPALLEAALWLQPAGAAVASEADLSLSAPGARWSGWRRCGPGGAPLRLSLLLPPGAAPALAAVLELRNLGAEAEDLLRVEWSELTGARLREPVAAGSGAAAGPFHRARPPVSASPPRLPAGEIPKVAQIRLQEHYETEDGGYRHLDILVVGMQAAGFTLAPPALQARPRRRRPGAGVPLPPGLAAHVRGVAGPAGGRARRLPPAVHAGARPRLPRRLRSERDRWMLLALIRLMPTAVATAAREVVSDPAEYQSWVDLAKRVAASLPRRAAAAG
jgi:hypothetical protein